MADERAAAPVEERAPDPAEGAMPTISDRELLQNLFADEAASMAAIDAGYRFIAFNATYATEFQRIAGHQPRIGESLLDLTAERPEVRSEIAALWARALSGQRFTVERRAGDGGARVLEVLFGPIRDAQGCIIGATHLGRDVTERATMEQALRESEERYRVLVEMAPECIYAYSGGKIIFANEAAVRLLGARDRAQLLGRSAWDIIHLDSMAEASARSCRLRREGLRLGVANPLMELTFQRLDGAPIAVEVASAAVTIDGRPAIQVALRDITERRLAEEALRRERELLQRIMDTIPVMITLYRADTRILQLNAAFERIVGWTTEEARTIDLMAACFPDPAYRAEVQAYMTSLEPGWRDVVMRIKDGRDLQTSWANIRLFDDTQVGIGIDISERKLAEERLHLLLQELNHRVKNMLSTVQSLAGLSLVGTRTLEEGRQVLTQRLHALAHAHDLLSLSGWQSVGLLALATTELEPFAGRVNVDGPDLALRPRAAQTLVLILHELATNAVKHGALSAPQGRVELRWEVIDAASGMAGLARTDLARAAASGWCGDGGAADGAKSEIAGGRAPQARLRLTWREHGGAEVQPPVRRGFGRRLIEQVASHDLQGTAELSFEPDGVRYHLVCPLPALMPDSPIASGT